MALGLSPAAVAKSSQWFPGLQLYTVRDALGTDLEATLRALAETGYREVELAGLPGITPALLRHHGLAVPSMHVGYQGLREDLDAALAEARTFGASFVVVPSIDHDERRTSDDWKRVCETLGRIGQAVRRHGLALAYHNHDYEFVAYGDGALPFDLLRGTDPSDVMLELDVYWIAKCGRDPLRCFAENAGRVPLVHLKDMARDGATAELGAGVLAMELIIRAALAAGARHLFVEQDESRDPLQSIASSLRFLERLPAEIRPGMR